MPRQEKDFQTEIKHAFDFWCRNRKKGGFYFKIPDLGYTNPFDCIMIANGKALGVELKINKAKNTFNFPQFFKGREHQKGYLQSVERGGGEGWFIINHFNLKPRVNKVYAMRVEQVMSLGTLRLEDVEEIAIEMPKIKGEYETYWDISVILD